MRALLKQSGIYLLARGVQGGLNFAAVIVYTHLLPPEEYGRYALVLAGASFVSMTMFQWLALALLRFYPTYQHEDRPLLQTIATGLTALGIGLGAVVVFAGEVIRTPSPWKGLLYAGVALTVGMAWFEITLSLERARLHAGRYAAMSVLRALLGLVVGSLIAWQVSATAWAPLLGWLAGLAVAGGLFGGYRWLCWIGRPDRALWGELLRYGLPFAATFALGFVIATSDRFLLAYFLGEDAAGIYAAAYDLATQSVGMLMMSVNLAAYPLVIRAYETEGIEAARMQLQQSGATLITIALPTVVGITALAPNIAQVALGEAFQHQAAIILSWSALAALLNGMRAYHFDLAFQLARQTYKQIWVLGIAALINLVLNWLWIPRFAVLGALYATVVAYIAALVLSFWLGRTMLRVPVPVKPGGVVAAAAIGMGITLHLLAFGSGVLGLLGQAIVGGLVYLVLLKVLGWGAQRIKRSV